MSNFVKVGKHLVDADNVRRVGPVVEDFNRSMYVTIHYHDGSGSRLFLGKKENSSSVVDMQKHIDASFGCGRVDNAELPSASDAQLSRLVMNQGDM